MTPTATVHRTLTLLATFVFAIAALWFGRPLLAPLAVALLLVFLLEPAIGWLERRGVRGPAAVVLVVASFLVGVAAVGLLVLVQAQSLVDQLPQYRSNIRERLHVLQEARKDTLSDDAQEALGELGSALEAETPRNATPVTVVASPALTDRL